jgi:hypothetical protein
VVTAIITIVAIIAGLAFVATANTWWAGKVRRNYLRAEYGADPVLTQRLIDKQYWAGMPRNQLIDSLGDPEATDKLPAVPGGAQDVQVLKYDRAGDKYRLRVRLDDGVVTSWEQEK